MPYGSGLICPDKLNPKVRTRGKGISCDEMEQIATCLRAFSLFCAILPEIRVFTDVIEPFPCCLKLPINCT